jgi:hypothetical protein
MRGFKCLLIPVAMTVALLGTSVPTGADPTPRPVESAVAGEGWGPLVPVPIPKRRVHVWATAISDLGHIAVAYTAVSRIAPPNDYPGDVIVRSPGGVWSTPHRLNPPQTVLRSVELGYDARGNLTAFWSSMTNTECCGDPDAPPPESTYTVATRPVHRRWTRHVRVGPVQLDDFAFTQDVVMSVAPSGKAVIGWRQYQESPDQFEFTVRVRKSADGPWGPARPLSAVSNRIVTGDVAINDHGTAIAAWTAARTWPADTASVQRSSRTRSGAWTTPVTIGRNADRGSGVGVASTPAGFTAITWVRHNGNRRTVVDLRTRRGMWSREVATGLPDSVAVGPHRTVVMVKSVQLSSGAIGARAVTWRTNRSDWTTTRLAPRRSNAWVLTLAVTSTGRIFAPWTQWREGIPQYGTGFMSTHSNAWATTELWDWTRNTQFAAAAASWNGRAVAIRTVTNLRAITTAVLMRVLRTS